MQQEEEEEGKIQQTFFYVSMFSYRWRFDVILLLLIILLHTDIETRQHTKLAKSSSAALAGSTAAECSV